MLAKKSAVAEALWWLGFAFVCIVGAISRLRAGETWVPAFQIVAAATAFYHFTTTRARNTAP